MEDKTHLTERQQAIYDFIREKIINRGYGPTVREIGQHFQIRSPNGVMCHLKALEKKGFITRESHMSRAIRLAESLKPRTILPLGGTIAAGQPVLADSIQETIDFSSLFDDGNLVCLRVRGESMIEDHIADGDYVIYRRTSEAHNGDIVVARVDGQEATLKRFYREPDRIRLEPANRGMQPIYAHHVDIEGVVVGVVRKYR